MQTTIVNNNTVLVNAADTWVPVTTEEIEQFCRDNERLLHSLIKPYRGMEDYDDLLQEAYIGFYKGIQSYSPGCGVKLTTFAYHCAKNELRMYLRKNSAKRRSAVVVPYECPMDDSGGNTSHYLDRNTGERDTLHSVSEGLEDGFLKTDICRTAMDIIQNRMTPARRDVFLAHLEGMKQVEIAREMGVSQAQVSRLLKEAVREISMKLRRIYGLTVEEARLI